MQAKAALRERVLAARAERSTAERDAAGAAIAATLGDLITRARHVAAYAAVGTEPPTAPALAACRTAQLPVLLPVLLPDGDLDWGDGQQTAPTSRGLLEPTGPRLGVHAIEGCDLVLVPALAVDGDGNRLGRGGGSYDRALRRATGLTVAVLYDGEQVDRVPAEQHDVRVAAVVTPSGLVRLR